MSSIELERLITNILCILGSGLLVGLICKRLGIALLVGYLLVGALIGQGGLGLVSPHDQDLEHLARAGALLLLFSVGIEFSWDEVAKLKRFLLVGGTTQMLLTMLPCTILLKILGNSWQSAMLLGAAIALSSTVLVFKALAESGQLTTSHGRRTLGILLFQDVALVPLVLFVPLLTGTGEAPTLATYGILILKSLTFIGGVILLHGFLERVVLPLVWSLKSVELLVLLVASLLGCVCYCAHFLGLPPAVGALAAGMMVAGSRLSHQIDSIILPFRETFAAVFFVSLGTLMQPAAFLREPLLLTSALLAVIAIKSAAGAVALRFTGLRWPVALGAGLGLAQLGEFSFLILDEGARSGAISETTYQRLLLVALGTLIGTPFLLRLGSRWTATEQDAGPSLTPLRDSSRWNRAIVIGMGPMGKQMASRLELQGIEVHAIDYSPINLHPLAQQGFATSSGDARDPDVLLRAGVRDCQVVVITVPDDMIAAQVAMAVRALSAKTAVIVRCRYVGSMAKVRKAGATAIVCEEAEASRALMDLCQRTLSNLGKQTISP